MGMSEDEFWNETLRATSLRIEGFRRKEEREYRADWERARWMAAVFVQPYATKGKTIRPTDLMKFPWEKQEARLLTPAEIERIRERDRAAGLLKEE